MIARLGVTSAVCPVTAPHGADRRHSDAMPNALIAFASRHGQTERIALRMGKTLADSGMGVDLVDLRRVRQQPPIETYSVVVLAGAVYFGRHLRSLERFARRNRAALESVDSVLVSVSGAAMSADGLKEAERYTADLTRRTGWTPRRTLFAGGAIRYTDYNPLLRWIMRRIAVTHGRGTDTTRDYEYTYWPEVEEFARALAPALAEAGAL